MLEICFAVDSDSEDSAVLVLSIGFYSLTIPFNFAKCNGYDKNTGLHYHGSLTFDPATLAWSFEARTYAEGFCDVEIIVCNFEGIIDKRDISRIFESISKQHPIVGLVLRNLIGKVATV